METLDLDGVLLGVFGCWEMLLVEEEFIEASFLRSHLGIVVSWVLLVFVSEKVEEIRFSKSTTDEVIVV